MQTDFLKLIGTCCNFVNTLKNWVTLILQILVFGESGILFLVCTGRCKSCLVSSLITSHYILFTKGWVFPVILLKCWSKFLFCSVFDRQTKHWANKLLIASTKQTKSQGLFDTELLNHAVTWCIMCQLNSVASCFTETWVLVYARYCITFYVRKTC